MRSTLARLRTMSRAELRHRLSSEARRRFGGIWTPATRDDAWVTRMVSSEASHAELPRYLARVLGARLYGPDWIPAQLADGLRAAGATDRLVKEADALRAHQFRVLGYGAREAGATIDWHRDLVSGGVWPRRWWGRMTRGRAQGWDPKVVWEPSRHQHLLVLAAAATLTGDAGYADEALEQVASWIEQNPTGLGVHWIEAMEPALRVLTWLWALPLLADAPRFTPALAASILRALVAQTRHVAANLSLYTSPNTHLICEALALFVAGTVLPELEAARGWREQGQAILEREIVLQVGDDGVYREASLYYHAYAVEFYLLAAVVAERNGVALAPVVRARLERMFEALAWLARPDGSLPNLGDGDGGRALRLGAPSLARVTELLASGAVLCGRGELRSGPTPTGEEAAWLWPDGASRVERFGWVAPPRGARHFADARLAVERRRRDGDERVLLFDAGDLGMLTGGHGHAGCLGLELYAQGRPLIVDRGTYVYNCAPAWRRYFRGTRAHSTVLIDDAEQAETAGEFRWATRYRSRIVRHVSTADYTVVTGEHDAYRRLGDPVRHRRTLLSVGGEYWVCVDQLDGVATHAAEFLFQLAPGLDVELLGATAVAMPEAGDGVTIASAGFGDAERRVITGASAADDTLQGWHSDDYGVKEPAATLSTREIVRLPAVRVHVLAPTPRAAAPLAVESRRLGDGLAVTIRHRGLTDLIFCSPGGPRRFTVDGGEFTGELLHARLEAHGAVRRYCAVTARTFRWQGELRLESEGIADWVVGDASGPDGVSAAPGARLVVPVARNARARARATLATSERG